MKHMRVIILILIAFTFTGAVTCKKDIGEDQYTTFYYRQTQCADPWQTGATDSLTLVNVSNYLNSQGLYVAALEMKTNGVAEMCLACICKTGKVITVSTFNNDSTKAGYTRVGFTQ